MKEINCNIQFMSRNKTYFNVYMLVQCVHLQRGISLLNYCFNIQ